MQRIIKISFVLLLFASSFVDGRANAFSPNFSPLQPSALIDVPQTVSHVLVAELLAGELHVFSRTVDNYFELKETMEVSIGKSGFGKQIEGDNKTPVGVYKIISHLTQNQLDDFYGHAAYPINYPNAWDKLNKRTGYGIWVHAEPVGSTYKTRPLLDSNGCVVLSNNDIDRIGNYLRVGYTPIVLTPSLSMTSIEAITETRDAIYQQLNAWQTAWESLRSESYLDFYSEEFSNLKLNLNQWKDYKIRVNGNKKYIDVEISDVGIYAYPDQENLMLVEFYQAYRSNNYQADGWKRQLWKLESDGQWRIIYEGGG